MLDWFLFFKQKTAYERRISDWSSDSGSSDLIANGIVLVDANAVLALDRHIGLVIAAATEKIIPNAQIFAFELRGQSQACVVNLLVILWRCLRWNLSFRGRSTVFALRPGSLTL